mgnify:CR=1 FL=1
MTAGELKTVLEHLAPETPVKIKIRNGDDRRLSIVKDPVDLYAKFESPDGRPVLTIEA